MKKLLLKLFKTNELILEIQKREWRFPPEESSKKWDNLLKKINQQFPEFVKLLKLREYNLAQSLVIADEKERDKLSARMAEVKYWQIKLLNPSLTSFSEEELKEELKNDMREVEKRRKGLEKFIERFSTKKDLTKEK